MSEDAGTEAPLEVGERVLLRKPQASDREEFSELRRSSSQFHRPWEPRAVPGVDPYGPGAFERYLKGTRQENLERTLICRREDAVILGAINLSEIVRGPLQSAYLGYWMGVAHAGQGYMSEGLRLLLRHAFTTLGLHRVEANIRPENMTSLKLVKRLGFTREGYSARYLKIAGDWRDHERWAILADDWARESGADPSILGC